MRFLERLGKGLVVVSAFSLASWFALRFGTGGLWRGVESAHAVTAPGKPQEPYDLTQLVAVRETLKTINDKYVDPSRVKPQQMFLSALNAVQREIAQVIVTHDEKAPTVKVQVENESRDFRVDNVQGHWDVMARLREVFVFLAEHLKGGDVDLRQVEYAACNGMLRTLDPHSVFMSPEAYKDMNMSTSGHFGGLGIVISVRDQQLTVMRPMPDTPAGRAGLRRLDRILKINSESTLNMPLDDAVGRLRGEPGTKVTVWVHRDGTDGWQGVRPFELVREEIRIRSVKSQELAPGVGYVRIEQFQSSTSDELDAALDAFDKKEKLRGLVLDLRGNPGGLLEQAAKVADKFIAEGVLVATVGASEGREEKRAQARGTEPGYPIAVLVNGSSASASEIVAGALKNLDRAVIVGQTTFGKGSVQLVFPGVTPDGAALKLTIAQYLTPGDVSIQGVGVAPDVELDPMTADLLEMDLYRSDTGGLKERDLAKSLASGGRRSSEQPYFKLRYDLPEKERAEMRDLGGDIDDEFRLDFPVRFARDLVQKLPPGKRQESLRQAKQFLDKAQEGEEQAIAADLHKVGIDWSAPPADAKGPVAADYEVKVETDRKDDAVTAGEPMSLTVTVKNNGKEPAYQLRALTQSDGPYWDEKELVFGKVAPGETRSAKVPLGYCEVEGKKAGSTKPLPLDARRTCRVPLGALARHDVVKVRFFAAGAEPPRDAEIRPRVDSLPSPIFAYAYQVVDDRPGNGDGQLARSEGATVYLTVKNVGKGRSYETQANLRNLSGGAVLLHAGRFDVSNLAPGETRQVAFTLDVLDQAPDSTISLEMSVSDRDLGVVTSEKLVLPLTRAGTFVQAATGKVSTNDTSPVRGQPALAAPVVGTLERGSVVERLGTVAEFTKVRLDGNRFAFVETRLVTDSTAPAKASFTPLLAHSPPLLEVVAGELATREDHVLIQGTATDGDRVIDAYVFVGSRKVYYVSNKSGADPKKLGFSYDVKLNPGTNVISVVTRENQDTATRYTRVVRRDGKAGEALPTPKGDQFGEDWDFGEE